MGSAERGRTCQTGRVGQTRESVRDDPVESSLEPIVIDLHRYSVISRELIEPRP